MYGVPHFGCSRPKASGRKRSTPATNGRRPDVANQAATPPTALMATIAAANGTMTANQGRKTDVGRRAKPEPGQRRQHDEKKGRSPRTYRPNIVQPAADIQANDIQSYPNTQPNNGHDDEIASVGRKMLPGNVSRTPNE